MPKRRPNKGKRHVGGESISAHVTARHNSTDYS